MAKQLPPRVPKPKVEKPKVIRKLGRPIYLELRDHEAAGTLGYHGYSHPAVMSCINPVPRDDLLLKCTLLAIAKREREHAESGMPLHTGASLHEEIAGKGFTKLTPENFRNTVLLMLISPINLELATEDQQGHLRLNRAVMGHIR